MFLQIDLLLEGSVLDFGIQCSFPEILLQRPSFFLSPFKFWLQSLADEGVSYSIVTAHIFVKHHDICKMKNKSWSLVLLAVF